MATPKKVDLKVYKGRTFKFVLRWEIEPIIYKAVTAIQQSAPIRLTVPAHGLTTGWYAAVTDVKGMTQINAESNNVKDADFRRVTRVDADTIEFNDISAASFSTYKSGGVVRYYTPASLVGYTARMDIKDKVNGAVLLGTSTTDVVIDLDDATHTISVTIPAIGTDDTFTATTGVYDLEVVSGLGEVECLVSGTVTFISEVTTSV